jgi:hypothetical protein
MKTRTLLLLSVGVGLAILLAGGVFLFQLSTESAAVEPASIGERVSVGDVDLTVIDTTEDAAVLAIDVEIGGVDDLDGIDSFRLITGDRRLDPVTAPADGRCVEITVTAQRCRIEFDVSAADGSSRVLVLRRGDEQRNWVLATS